MKDVLQGQESGPDYVTGTGATQIGLVVHETVEQLGKAKRGLQKGDFDMASYTADHNTACAAEEKVNFLHRQLDVPGIKQGEVDIYYRATKGNQVANYPAYPPTTVRVGSDPKRTVTITHTIPAQRIK